MSNMKNIVVLVSGGGTNLQALIDAQNRNELGNGKITCVISSKADAYALERARNNGIKCRTLIRKDFPDISSYSGAMRDMLLEEKADLVVYAGFMTILNKKVCDEFPNKMINVHPALIPSFCGKGFYGLHVHEAALKKGVKVSGATVHFVTAECDAGPIILQKAVEVMENDTPETLQKRIMEQAEWKILPKAVQLFCDDKITVVNGRTIINELGKLNNINVWLSVVSVHFNYIFERIIALWKLKLLKTSLILSLITAEESLSAKVLTVKKPLLLILLWAEVKTAVTVYLLKTVRESAHRLLTSQRWLTPTL